jgi:hypothetical protein
MKLFNRKPIDTVSTTPKKKPRGKAFTGKGDPRINLSGRPKLGATLAARYRDALSEAESDARGGEYTKLDAMIDILIGKAMEGDQRAIEYLNERGFGKVPDRLELGKLDEEPEKYNLKLLTLDEQITLRKLLGKAAGEQTPDSPIILEAVTEDE